MSANMAKRKGTPDESAFAEVVGLSRTKRPKEREFYLRMTAQQRRQLREVARQIDGGLFERAALNLPRLSTALREMQPPAEPRFHDEGELQPAAIHKEYLSVRSEVAGHGQRCDGKQICVTVSRVSTADLDWHFKPELDALLEVAST